MSNKFRFSIDRGGTFTDIYAEVPGTPGYLVYKLLSVDPAYDDAPREGIRRILEKVTGKSVPKDNVDTSQIEWIRMGTTVATNALLERKGERMALVTTKGFRDLLQIGNQARPAIFDLEIKKPELLYECVVEVEERVRLAAKDGSDEGYRKEKGLTGETVEILQEPDLEKLKADLKPIYDSGIRSVAVVLMHSYTFNKHEQIVGDVCREMGFTQVSQSSSLMPMVRIVPRGQTSCVDAYLTPLILKYVEGFGKGFDDNFHNVKVYFMMSDGGLCPVNKFSGFRSILSGPAGGVVGYSVTTYNKETKQPVIGFDMGGTSTDVSRYAGSFEHVFDTETAGVMIQAPQLNINTVAAGGGSRLFFRSGLFVVGPESASAHPGPVCYRKGGYLAITDANLFLGRLLPSFFPKIFGKTEDQPLDEEATRKAFVDLTKEINQYLTERNLPQMTEDEVAYGFIKVANEAMCRPIRSITEAKGYEAGAHILSCFGGAGGQHACAIARSLGMKTVFIHRFAGILSAYGLGLADLVEEYQEPCAMSYAEQNMEEIYRRLQILTDKAREDAKKEGFSDNQVHVEPFLNLRYSGTDTSIMTALPNQQDGVIRGDYAAAFEEQHKREYGFTVQGRPIIVDDIRARGVGHGTSVKPVKIKAAEHEPKPVQYCEAYFEKIGRTKTAVYLLSELGGGSKLQGPAIIIDQTSTIVVEPDCQATITPDEGNIVIDILKSREKNVGTEVDSVQLSVFAHRFMGIAEQMGKTLQRTSVSTNIKERLDFSCALFGPDGGLVANAPHLPVHLGAMQEAVRWQIQHLGSDWKQGEVLVSNHPSAGGSHLPDITVITPVYHGGKAVFYVASRGHHADIGGITPGSMPPFSKTLQEEGAAIKSFKLVRDGVFQEEEIKELLKNSRNLSDNLSDLKAQVAANRKGITLTEELISEYGLEVVVAYMHHVQNSAEQAVRDMLKEISLKYNLQPIDTLHATDYMDDGSPITLALTIDREKGTATFDFTGTGLEVYGNCNAPPAVTKSAIIYCLRCLVKRDIPLNQGCLNPIDIKIPSGSILYPSDTAAVVGGNVLTSQRVTDVILSAFRACAASQGCMNNFTFGDPHVGYYETIAGGAGAGPTWNGTSAVQVHMTNTRITDAEILERRYRVLLKEFSVRHGSGGKGEFNGGDGVIREIEFLKPYTLGILSERRSFEPPGLLGGGPAQRGMNLLIKADGRQVNLGGKNSVDVDKGDVIRIMTPGGGAYGKSI